MPSSEIAFCLAEDRADCEIGLRLAILGLCRHCPGTPVYVYRPASSSTFADWAKQFPQVLWIPHTPVGADTWNCKPQALKPLLADGFRQAVWLDSDILVTRDFRELLTGLDDSVLAVAQDPGSAAYPGTAERTQGWNFEVRRALPFTLNSSVLRVTPRHLPLLNRWMECLGDPRYLAAQALPLEQRPVHMMGDQDLLNALIGAPGFEDIPLHIFATATDIIHAGGALGYSLVERLNGLFKPKPAFLHAIAGKPWLWLGGGTYWSQPNFFSWHRRLLQELSPYLAEARAYRRQLGEDSQWMDRRTATGTLLRVLGLGHFALRGLPLTVAASIIEPARKMSARMQKLRNPPASDCPDRQ